MRRLLIGFMLFRRNSPGGTKGTPRFRRLGSFGWIATGVGGRWVDPVGGEFVESVLTQAREQYEKKTLAQRQGVGLDSLFGQGKWRITLDLSPHA